MNTSMNVMGKNPSLLSRIRQQRGVAFLATVSAMFGVLTLMVISFSSVGIQKKLNQGDSVAKEQISAVLDDINLEIFDPTSVLSITLAGLAPNQTLSSDEIRAVLKRPHMNSIQMAISPPMANCSVQVVQPFDRCVSWRRFAAWIPLNAAQVVQHPLVNGLPEGAFALAEHYDFRSNQESMKLIAIGLEDQLTNIAESLRVWYQTRRLMDPYRGASHNFWLPLSCLHIRANDLPCRSETDFEASKSENSNEDAIALMHVLGKTSNELLLNSNYTVTFKNQPPSSDVLTRAFELRLHSMYSDLFIHLLIPQP